MINQIPRRQIIQSIPEEMNNMKKTQGRPINMTEYDSTVQPYRPMEGQPRESRTTPQTPSAMPQTPVGMPQGPTQVEPSAGVLPSEINFTGAPIGIPVFDPEFTQGYLRQSIGQKIKVEFLIGTNMLIDREGVLTDVGISYIIINETETDDLLLCDIYSIKFVRFYR